MSIEEFGCGQRWGPITYAQHGDDLFIINLFELIGIERPTYLDIGANHPFVISNTALLYKRGSRGVNVEANPDLMDEFYHHRPDDKNINIGVSPKSGEMEFYLFMDGNGLNTFSASERDKTIGSGNQLKEIRMIQTITLNEVIEAYCNGEWPNLLSIDCEGLDYDILCTAKIENGPDVICVETRRHDTQKMKAIVQSHGYKLVTRLAENLIFVRNDQFEKGY